MDFIETMGYRVFSDDLAKIKLMERCQTINTISPNSYGMAAKDALFREALQKSDYLVLDGVYFALGSLLLKGKNIKRNQGPDVFDYFIRFANTKSLRVFFLGSTDSTLDKIRDRCVREFPGLAVEVYSPPFKPQFSREDTDEMLDRINDFGPDIVFVGMTAPKQEKWSYSNKERINAKLIISIGAVFDWFAGNEKPIAPIWWKLRMAWLIRTIHRPEILWRYKNIFVFFAHLMLAVAGVKKFKYGQF